MNTPGGKVQERYNYQHFQDHRLFESKRYKKNWILLNLNTSTLAIWMDKVGTTSKCDVKQKEKKP